MDIETMTATDQIAAEAAEKFRLMIVERHRWDVDSPVCGQLRNIIKSACKKAYNTGYVKGFHDRPLDSLESRTAHASEQDKATCPATGDVLEKPSWAEIATMQDNTKLIKEIQELIDKYYNGYVRPSWALLDDIKTVLSQEGKR